VGSGCNGIAALALMPAYPEAAAAILRAVQNIKERYRAMADDGSCVEGNLYWDYGFSYQLLFGHALERVTGDDHDLLTAPNLMNTHRFVETQLGGDGRYFPFNDTQPWLTGLAVCADFGSRLDNPLLRWMADHTSREAANETTPVFTRPQFYALAFRARDRKPAAETFPGVPTLSFLDSLHWGVLRSDSSFMPEFVVGVKGRDGTLTHHAQEDLGGFVLQAQGDSFLIDPGYYQPKGEAHSIPLVDGNGPDKRGSARISDAREHGKLRTMTVDASLGYGVKRLRRVFALYGDRFVAVLDDIDCQGRVTAQYQCGFPTLLNDDRTAATIAGKMMVRPHLPGLKLEVEGPLDFGKSWIFKETGVPWYRVRGDYNADPDHPLVTVFAFKPVPVKRTDSAIVIEEVRFERTDAGLWRVADMAIRE
jgi:hypothetical protein